MYFTTGEFDTVRNGTDRYAFIWQSNIYRREICGGEIIANVQKLPDLVLNDQYFAICKKQGNEATKIEVICSSHFGSVIWKPLDGLSPNLAQNVHGAQKLKEVTSLNTPGHIVVVWRQSSEATLTQVMTFCLEAPGPRFNIKTVFLRYGIPMLKIRQSRPYL